MNCQRGIIFVFFYYLTKQLFVKLQSRKLIGIKAVFFILLHAFVAYFTKAVSFTDSISGL